MPDNEIIGRLSTSVFFAGRADVNSFGVVSLTSRMILGRYDDIGKTNADRARANVVPSRASFDPVSLNIVTARINRPRWFSPRVAK